MRAVKGSLGYSLLERNERAWEDLFVASLDGRSQDRRTPLLAGDVVGGRPNGVRNSFPARVFRGRPSLEKGNCS